MLLNDITDKMQYTLEKEIKSRLRNSQSKKQIYKALSTDTNEGELLHLLNNFPSQEKRRKTLIINWFLLLLLALLTIKQCLFIYLQGRFDIAAILALIGPMIHFFIMRELLIGHRLGYQLLPVLSILALFRPENRISPDMYMYMCMAALSSLLYLILFPKNDQLHHQTP